jgi:hypothetical protein
MKSSRKALSGVDPGGGFGGGDVKRPWLVELSRRLEFGRAGTAFQVLKVGRRSISVMGCAGDT